MPFDSKSVRNTIYNHASRKESRVRQQWCRRRIGRVGNAKVDPATPYNGRRQV